MAHMMIMTDHINSHYHHDASNENGRDKDDVDR